MDVLFNELREKAMDAAQTIGQQVSSIAVDVGQQVASLAVDVGQQVSAYADDISSSVNGILARAFNDFVRLLATCETKEVCVPDPLHRLGGGHGRPERARQTQEGLPRGQSQGRMRSLSPTIPRTSSATHSSEWSTARCSATRSPTDT